MDTVVFLCLLTMVLALAAGQWGQAIMLGVFALAIWVRHGNTRQED